MFYQPLEKIYKIFIMCIWKCSSYKKTKLEHKGQVWRLLPSALGTQLSAPCFWVCSVYVQNCWLPKGCYKIWDFTLASGIEIRRNMSLAAWVAHSHLMLFNARSMKEMYEVHRCSQLFFCSFHTENNVNCWSLSSKGSLWLWKIVGCVVTLFKANSWQDWHIW